MAWDSPGAVNDSKDATWSKCRSEQVPVNTGTTLYQRMTCPKSLSWRLKYSRFLSSLALQALSVEHLILRFGFARVILKVDFAHLPYFPSSLTLHLLMI